MMTNLADDFTSIETGLHAADWREAITLAGRGLVAGGASTDEYTREMIAAVDEHGPYIVIAPGFALAHSRPSPAVLKPGLSWVGLAEPVLFGHATNDPVKVVVGLAATDPNAHLEVMATLAGVLSDEAVFQRLLDAASVDDVRTLLSGSED